MSDSRELLPMQGVLNQPIISGFIILGARYRDTSKFSNRAREKTDNQGERSHKNKKI